MSKPKFSSKHYVALAKALSDAKPKEQNHAAHRQWVATISIIAEMLEEDNPRFDWPKFLNTILADSIHQGN